VSPVNDAFAGVEPDSLPPVPSVSGSDSAATSGWIGAAARLARRGTPVPVVSGREGRGGRTVTIGADGLFRWPLRGGVAQQVWRTMIADAASWLLSGTGSDSTLARPISPVTQRGQPVKFRWVGSGAPVPLAIELRGPRGIVNDTLRFDGGGEASVTLGVGRYGYTLNRGGSGSLAVEPFSDELVPGPVTLAAHAGTGGTGAPRRPMRELLWLFGVAIAGLGVEWMLRHRLGMR
ncbi:MAG: hypothetical protein ACRELE_05330, partial [Gemmatimonadales bacterium]